MRNRSRAHPFIVLASAILCGLPAAAGAQAAGTNTQGISLQITPGPGYDYSQPFLLFFRLPQYPQVACWIETDDGVFVGTVYATRKGAKRAFYAAPSAGRPEALPVWYHRQTGSAPALDAVSGATSAPSPEIRKTAPRRLRPGRYVVFLEVNRAYDYNDTYTRTSSGVNGQPSLVYRATLDIADHLSSAQLALAGTGSVDGADGAIRDGTPGVTTALGIIAVATVGYQP